MNRLPDSVPVPYDQMLAPLAVDAPCGPALRYDPVFTEIRLLREEDDPTLPMGQWERPLKRADWGQIAYLCGTTLATRSKDLQIAAWLIEAMLRQHGLAGLHDGLRLFDTLLQRYWPHLHPVVDVDGDADARLAPFEWINESLATSVRLHAVLLVLDVGTPVHLTLAAWERMTAQEMAPAPPPAQAGRTAAVTEDPVLTRADIAAAAQGLAADVQQAVALVDRCGAILADIAAFLHRQWADDAPNLGKLDAALAGAARTLAQLYVAPEALVTPAPAAPDQVEVAVAAPAPAGSHWRTRAEAYATLEALADYLSDVEPHSPTPFLIRRAVKWGSMSLPEVIAEIIREEGDVSRLFNVLGIRL